ncbi:hypothetical protein Tco_1548986 [Tanacetum coccineum]
MRNFDSGGKLFTPLNGGKNCIMNIETGRPLELILEEKLYAIIQFSDFLSLWPDYPTDRDDDDKEEDESSRDDDDDDKEEDENEDEEEEHQAPADSISPPIFCTTSRMSIRDQTPISFSFEAEYPFPPLPVSSPLPISPPPLPASPTHSLGYRAPMIRLTAESPSSSHSLPLPIVLLHTRASMAMMRVAAPSTYILASR